jgi:pyruvate kinase
MIENNFPSKTEVAGITNAVLDGCLATMWSGEAISHSPVIAVQNMRRIADTAFAHLGTRSHFYESSDNSTPSQAIADAIAMILRSIPVP